MNNEIKEKIPFNVRDVLEDINSNILWNYITNLQQQNEKEKENAEWWADRFFGQQTYDDSYRITAIEYKKRIEKAIEYIKEHIRIDDEYPDYMEMLIEERDNLLNILQNGSDSQ